MFSHKAVNRSLLTLCLVFAVILGATIFIVRERTGQIINQLSIDRVLAAKQGFDIYLHDLAQNAKKRATVLANQDRLIDAINEYEDNGFELTEDNYTYIRDILDEFLIGYDFLSITDRNGIALARVDNGEREYPLPLNGYDLSVNPDVAEMLNTGEPVAALSFMLDNTTLVATTLYPIFDGDTLIGSITCLSDLTNPKYINAYKEQSGSEAAIFLGHEEFISTLTFSENPIRLGAGRAVIEAIFDRQEEQYISFFSNGDTTYGTVFSPLVYRGDIIGMIFNGVDVNEAEAIRTEMNMLIIYIAALAAVIALIFIFIMRRYSTAIKEQMALQTLMTRITQSFMTDKDLDILITDAFSELARHMRVSQFLLLKIKPGEPPAIVCTNEWIDPVHGIDSRIGEEITVTEELLGAYADLKEKDRFYISSDTPELSGIIEPHRVHFHNFLTTGIFINDDLYAILDIACLNKRKKWSRDDVNAASFLASVLTAAFHRKQIEEQLVSAKDIAESSSKYKSAFLANVSHEIRTPMNAILGVAEIYLQDRDPRANIEEGLSMIYDSGSLLLGIANNILDMSKIEAGKMEIIPVMYDIPSLINDSVQICRLRYGSKQVEFHLDIDKQTPLNLIGDELRIKQILNNILSNAFKYTDSGEITLSVSADRPMDFSPEHVSDEGSSEDMVTLIFRVRDTGQGMTPEQLDMIFDEFTRFNMDVNRTTVGTGLGMSITKQLVTLMNGDIRVDSKPGKGTTFTVYIPQLRADKAVCGPEMSDRLNSFNFYSMTLRKKSQIVCEYMPYGSVLVVDDVDSNLFVAKGMLIPYGLKIETAGSGFEAIEYVTSGKTYDIIFMDHMMPKMDGIETTKNLRSMGYKGYIIALTANALVGQAKMFLENGFDSYIPKPVDTRELNTALIEFIRNKKPASVVNAAREEAREAELLRAAQSGDSAKTAADEAKAAQDKAELEMFFVQDAENIIDVLTKEYENLAAGRDIDIDMYHISTHGIKNALRHVGEKQAAELAYELEQAALSKDFNTISARTPELIESLKEIAGRLSGGGR